MLSELERQAIVKRANYDVMSKSAFFTDDDDTNNAIMGLVGAAGIAGAIGYAHHTGMLSKGWKGLKGMLGYAPKSKYEQAKDYLSNMSGAKKNVGIGALAGLSALGLSGGAHAAQSRFYPEGEGGMIGSALGYAAAPYRKGKDYAGSAYDYAGGLKGKLDAYLESKRQGAGEPVKEANMQYVQQYR